MAFVIVSFPLHAFIFLCFFFVFFFCFSRVQGYSLRIKINAFFFCIFPKEMARNSHAIDVDFVVAFY